MGQPNPILDILRLYEYSMSIGKNLDYHDNCNHFLKLLLKRVNFNASWILSIKKDVIKKEYSLPQGTPINRELSTELKVLLTSITEYILLPYDHTLEALIPISISDGHLAIFKLENQSFLFLYSKEAITCNKALNQLIPVINKFAITLKACEADENQKLLLKRLEDRNKELNDYAHIVSHDLKSPLRNINALATWIKEDYQESISDQATEYIDLICDNIARMESFVNGILEYSTIGLKDVRNSFIDLNKILNDIKEHIYIPEKITLKIHPNFPTIKGDHHRLHQLFQNLISNAVKYNDKEKGIIEVGYTIKDNVYEYFVKDNGMGIEKKFYEKIFNIFQKLGNNDDATGIGLSIVQKIVKSYHGKVWLTSEVGKGTTFYFTLTK